MTEPEVTQPSYMISWSGMSHVGKVRKNNEDAFLAVAVEPSHFQYLGKTGEGRMDTCDYVFAVSDGMGGANAGEFASRTAVDKITKLLPKAMKMMAIGMQAGFEDIFEELFNEIHQALSYLGSQYEECSGMGSTLSLCWFCPGWMYFGHIGDSRIYYLPKGGKLKQLTEDNTHVGWLFRQGKITEYEARTHPRKNSLQRALGAGHQFVDPQVGAVGLERGDCFLLCTDGVVDGLWDKHIGQLLYEPDEVSASQKPAERLVAEAVGRSGKDNTTAVVVEVC